jgi:tetratricopeptide (TPR) repeat protein
LIVVDYAASSAQILRTWLQQLAQNPQYGPKLRLLLLERHADTSFGWWADVTRREGWADGAEDLLDPLWPVMLPLLEGDQTWRSILAVLINKVAAFRQRAVPADLDQWLEAHSAALRYADPLQILMAGVVMIEEEAAAVLGRERLDLARGLGAVELGRLNKLARDRRISEAFFKRLAASVNLQQGGNSEEIAKLVEEEAAAGSQVFVHGVDHVVHALQDALPGQELGSVDAIRPDLVGEAVILQAVSELRMSIKQQAGLVERAWRRSGSPVIARLVRMAQDYGGTDRKHQSLVWLDHTVHLTNDAVALRGIISELPSRTVILREVAAKTQGRMVSALLKHPPAEPEQQWALAEGLTNFAIRLRDIGRNGEALVAARNSVTVWRSLAMQHPDSILPGLALALNNLANALNEAGRCNEAAAAAKEAVDLYRLLDYQHPEIFRFDFAGSLANLAERLSQVGQHSQALIASQEAVRLFAILRDSDPDIIAPNFAQALTGLGRRLHEVGRHGEALAALEAALMQFRELASRQPDAFRPDLAMALD